MKSIKTLTIALALAAAASFALPALAQQDVIPAPVTEYKFKGSLVEGDKLIPDGTLVAGDARKKTSGMLIRVRHNFVGEMIKTVEDM
jgi:hypothetical protein